MNIKFSQKKQDIREDPVLDFFLKAKDFSIKNVNYLIGAVIAIAVIAGFVFIYLQTKDRGSDKAQEGFGRAMIEFNNGNVEKAVDEFKSVADKHSATASGAESALMLGSIHYNIGRYEEAQQWYEKAEENGASFGFIIGGAREGLATCYESKGDLARAIEYLEKALNDNRYSYRHGAIRWKMALLSRKADDMARVRVLCGEIVADTSAAAYHQRAENLLAVLDAVAGPTF